jgi:hypothetical protein
MNTNPGLGYGEGVNPIIPTVRQQILDLTGRDIGHRRTCALINEVRAAAAEDVRHRVDA